MVVLFFRPDKFLDFDPRMRHTIWNIAVNTVMGKIKIFGMNQVAIMRAKSLRRGDQNK